MPQINGGLSAIGVSTKLDGSAGNMVKLANIANKNNKHIKDKIKSEIFKIKAERSRIEEKRKYWIEQLSQDNIDAREYNEVYNDLYEYSRVSIENNLKPLKEYYFFNPHDFNP